MTAAILALGAFCAGLLKTGFGQGGGFLAVPICTLVVPARFAVALLSPLLSLGDFISVPAYWRRWDTRLLVVLVPGQIAGTVVGAWALAHMSETSARRAIGALLIIAALFQFVQRRARSDSPRPMFVPAAVAVSVFAGFTSSIAQIGSGFLAVYMVRLGKPKDAIVPTLNMAFMFSNLVKIAVYWHYALVTPTTLLLDAALAPMLLAGGFAGVWTNRRLSQHVFENALLAFALVSGARMLLWK